MERLKSQSRHWMSTVTNVIWTLISLFTAVCSGSVSVCVCATSNRRRVCQSVFPCTIRQEDDSVIVEKVPYFTQQYTLSSLYLRKPWYPLPSLILFLPLSLGDWWGQCQGLGWAVQAIQGGGTQRAGWCPAVLLPVRLSSQPPRPELWSSTALHTPARLRVPLPIPRAPNLESHRGRTATATTQPWAESRVDKVPAHSSMGT